MALTFTGRTSGTDTTDATSYVTASVSPAANAMLLVFVTNAFATTAPDAPTVSSAHSLLVGWTEIKTHPYDSAGAVTGRVSVWGCITGATPGSGAITMSFGSQTQLGARWSVVDITGVSYAEGLGPSPGKAVVQAVAVTGVGTAGANTLLTNAHPDNRAIVCYVHQANEVSEPRASWTEIHDVADSSPNTAFATQYRSDVYEAATTATWTTSTPYGSIALEINAAPPLTVRSMGAATLATTTTAVTVTKPAGLITGDVLYAVVANGGANAAPSTVPTGWTLVDSGGGTTWWGGVYRKIITNAAGEPADYTWDGFTDSCTGAMVAVMGADTTTPEHMHAVRANTNSPDVGTAGFTTTVTGCLILSLMAEDDNQLVSTWACATDPTTMFEQLEQLSSGGVDTGVGIASALQGAAGATGASSYVLVLHKANTGFLIAVQPPQGGGYVDNSDLFAFFYGG